MGDTTLTGTETLKPGPFLPEHRSMVRATLFGGPLDGEMVELDACR